MELSIIVVNYNNYTLTENCIKSVLRTVKDIKFEIIVIDNNSPNNSFHILSEKFRNCNNVRIIKNSNNEGFGLANNKAVEASKANVLLFLNPDIEVLEGAISNLYKRLLSDEKIGIIGAKLLNKDLTLQYSCRKVLKLGEFLIARTPLKKIVSKAYVNKLEDRYLLKYLNHDEEIEADWIMGSCMMINKNVFLSVGGFSKDYFMYFEDVDLCYKVRKLGKIILYYPEAKMIHLHNQESVKKINKLTLIHLKSMFTFYRKLKANRF